MKNLVLFLACIVLVTGCGVQKRKYQKGYYVNWNNSRSHDQKLTPAEKTPKRNPTATTLLPVAKNDPPQADREKLYASANLNTVNGIAAFIEKTAKTEPCDEIFFNDGSDLKVNVLEITTDEIKYRKCDMPDGPLYVAKKSNVFLIKYANGTRETFNKPAPQIQSGARPASKNTYTGPKKMHPMAIASLVMGIVSLLPYVTLLTAILAIVFANIALRDINADPDHYKGEVAAKTGKTMGIVFLSLIGLVLLLLLFLLLFFL